MPRPIRRSGEPKNGAYDMTDTTNENTLGGIGKRVEFLEQRVERHGRELATHAERLDRLECSELRVTQSELNINTQEALDQATFDELFDTIRRRLEEAFGKTAFTISWCRTANISICGGMPVRSALAPTFEQAVDDLHTMISNSDLYDDSNSDASHSMDA
jgi:hypothetical protein